MNEITEKDIKEFMNKIYNSTSHTITITVGNKVEPSNELIAHIPSTTTIEIMNILTSFTNVNKEPHPMIPPNQFFKASEEMHDDAWILLANKDGNIVNMSTGVVICTNECSVANYSIIEEQFEQYDLIDANEAIEIIRNQEDLASANEAMNIVANNVDTINSLKEKIHRLESYIARKCMEEQ